MEGSNVTFRVGVSRIYLLAVKKRTTKRKKAKVAKKGTRPRSKRTVSQYVADKTAYTMEPEF